MEKVSRLVQGGQPNLNAEIIKSIRFVLPPLAKQRDVSNVLVSASDQINGYSQQVQSLRAEKRALMQQLLTGKRRVKL